MSGEGAMTDRVAVVTGASRGIGAATARAFAAQGARVVLAARDEAALTGVRESIASAGGDATVVPTDVSDERSVTDLIDRTVSTYGRLDFAVNSAAAHGHRPMPLADVEAAAFDEALAVSVRGVFLAMKHEIRAMLANGSGAIVNLSSTAGTHAVSGLAGYVASKHAVIGLTKTAALDYADAGVRVNALAPGPILTERLEQAGPEAQAGVAAAVPVQRLGQPEEVAQAALWLCGDESRFVTGTTLTIDGGRMAGTKTFQSGDSRAERR